VGIWVVGDVVVRVKERGGYLRRIERERLEALHVVISPNDHAPTSSRANKLARTEILTAVGNSMCVSLHFYPP
jgi:hypothetical protein